MQRGHWSFLGLANEEKWYGSCNYKPEGKCDQQANQMIEVFARSGHPVFRCCLRNMRRSKRWLRYGVGAQSTMRIKRLDTAQSERALVRFIDTSSLQAVCIKPKESCTCHPCTDCVTSCVVLLVLGAHHHTPTSRMVAELMVAPLGSTAVYHHHH